MTHFDHCPSCASNNLTGGRACRPPNADSRAYANQNVSNVGAEIEMCIVYFILIDRIQHTISMAVKNITPGWV